MLKSKKQQSKCYPIFMIQQIKKEISRTQHSWRMQSRDMTLHHEMKKFTIAFRENFFTLIISSFGLLVALSWNNFWSTWVSSLSTENTMPYKFIIAISMTLLAVILTYLFSRMKGSGN